MLRRPLLFPAQNDGNGLLDSSCLLCVRPAYVGGAWTLADASPHDRDVTISGLTVGDAGTGPFDGSRGIIDSTGPAYAYASGAYLTDATAIAIWCKPNYTTSLADVFLRICSNPSSDYYQISVHTRAGDSSRIKFDFTARNTVDNNQLSDLVSPGNWYHVYMEWGTSGYIRNYLNGAYLGENVVSVSLGTTPTLMVGKYKSNNLWPDASGDVYAEVAVWSAPPWEDDFTPPSGPYTED